MKLKCIRNWITDPNGYERDLSEYLTIGKIYYISKFFEPCSEWVYCIIDDTNQPHDMSKDMFIDIVPIERDMKLKALGI
jgi:hypothetical protein